MKERLTNGRNLKKILSIVLVLAMVITLLPLSGMTVYAESSADYNDRFNGWKQYDSYTQNNVPTTEQDSYINSRGYKFLGWSSVIDDKNSIVATEPTSGIYYAVWENSDGNVVVTKELDNSSLNSSRDKGITLSADGKTLTLTNVSIDGDFTWYFKKDTESSDCVGINLSGSSVDKIVLVGSSNIGRVVDSIGNFPVENEPKIAINTDSNLVITGSGNLNIYDTYKGIYSSGVITFDNDFSANIKVLEKIPVQQGDQCCLKANTITIKNGTFDLQSDGGNALDASTVNIEGGYLKLYSLHDEAIKNATSINIYSDATVKAGSDSSSATERTMGTDWKSTLVNLNFVSVSPSRTKYSEDIAFTATNLIAGKTVSAAGSSLSNFDADKFEVVDFSIYKNNSKLHSSVTLEEGNYVVRVILKVKNSVNVYFDYDENNSDTPYKKSITLNGNGIYENMKFVSDEYDSSTDSFHEGVSSNGDAIYLLAAFPVTLSSSTPSTPTPSSHTHSVVTDSAVAATCTTSGKTAGTHCSSCGKVLTEQTEIPAKGHDFTGAWTTTKEPTATEDGTKETTCKNGCGTKQIQKIPATGLTDKEEEQVEDEPFKDDPNAGKIDKAAEVAPEAPVESATLDNTKADLVNNADIFTEEEKQAVKNGEDAKVWLEIDAIDESKLEKTEVAKVQKEATKSLGETSTVKYFDASLFKKVGSGEKTTIHEPGIDIQVTITIPSDMLNLTRGLTRKYRIIRLHDGEVSVINGSFDKRTNEFSFKTDRFSTYAIAFGDVPTVVEEIAITKPTSTTIDTIGKTIQIQVQIGPDDAVDKTLTWSSSDEKVATVDKNGLVTAVGNGTAIITASSADGNIKDSITITVNAPVPAPVPVTDAPVEETTNTNEAINAGLKVSQTGSSIKVKWGAVTGADGYLVYATYCGSKFTNTPVKTTKKTSVSITKINGKKLNLKKNFKVYVKAYKLVDGKKVILGKSITAHIVGKKNTKYTNVKSINIKSKTSLELEIGKTSKIKASVVLVDKKKKQLSDAHTSTFRYASSNTKVAMVDKNGKITAVAIGTCTVYVYARNGYAKKINVTVK